MMMKITLSLNYLDWLTFLLTVISGPPPCSSNAGSKSNSPLQAHSRRRSFFASLKLSLTLTPFSNRTATESTARTDMAMTVFFSVPPASQKYTSQKLVRYGSIFIFLFRT